MLYIGFFPLGSQALYLLYTLTCLLQTAATSPQMLYNKLPILFTTFYAVYWTVVWTWVCKTEFLFTSAPKCTVINYFKNEHNWTTDSSGLLLYSALMYCVTANNLLYTKAYVYTDLTWGDRKETKSSRETNNTVYTQTWKTVVMLFKTMVSSNWS